jgi:hypothetical protein
VLYSIQQTASTVSEKECLRAAKMNMGDGPSAQDWSPELHPATTGW